VVQRAVDLQCQSMEHPRVKCIGYLDLHAPEMAQSIPAAAPPLRGPHAAPLHQPPYMPSCAAGPQLMECRCRRRRLQLHPHLV
jgi:hypothetical protein